jgi:hypothetical protein
VITSTGLFTGSAISAENREMPKKDVSDFPAIGLSNLMYNLARHEPIVRLKLIPLQVI